MNQPIHEIFSLSTIKLAQCTIKEAHNKQKEHKLSNQEKEKNQKI